MDRGGIGPVGFTMVADVKHAIAQAYGIEHPEAGVALRASFLIDRAGVVQHQVVNNLPLPKGALPAVTSGWDDLDDDVPF